MIWNIRVLMWKIMLCIVSILFFKFNWKSTWISMKLVYYFEYFFFQIQIIQYGGVDRSGDSCYTPAGCCSWSPWLTWTSMIFLQKLDIWHIPLIYEGWQERRLLLYTIRMLAVEVPEGDLGLRHQWNCLYRLFLKNKA